MCIHRSQPSLFSPQTYYAHRLVLAVRSCYTSSHAEYQLPSDGWAIIPWFPTSPPPPAPTCYHMYASLSISLADGYRSNIICLYRPLSCDEQLCGIRLLVCVTLSFVSVISFRSLSSVPGSRLLSTYPNDVRDNCRWRVAISIGRPSMLCAPEILSCGIWFLIS